MRRAALFAVLALTTFVAFAGDTPFVRTSDDGQQTEIGPRGSAARTHSLHFTIAEADLDRWPEPVTVSVVSTEGAAKWSVPIPSRFAVKPHTIVAPAGSYDVTFAAPHYRPTRRVVKLSTDQHLGTIALDRYPVISGTLRTKDGTPVVGALISDRAKGSSQSDPSGMFQLEITGDWPKLIEISYPGLATTDIVLPKAQASTKLPQITMVKGSRLTLEVEGLTVDADVELARESGYKRFDALRTAHIKTSSPRHVFEDIERGKYAVLIKGEGPLQRTSTNIDVDQDSMTSVARIEPVALTISVSRGEEPVSGAVVAVQTGGTQWSSEMRTGDDGRIAAEAWQRGNLVFAVRVDEKAAPAMMFKSLDAAAKEASIQLDIPNHKIIGRVVDDNGGSPIADATVEVDSTNDDGSGGKLTVKSEADGSFRVDGLPDGAHELFARAENYQRSDTTKLRLDQSSPNKQITIRMSQGLARTLHLVTPAGWPIVNAMVAESVNGALGDLVKSNDTGKVTLRAPAGARVSAYVIPHEGSFAIVHLAPDENDKTVTVPDGNASLEIHAIDRDSKPIAHLEFVMWFDGELIPQDIADVLSIQRDLGAVTGADGVARMDRLPSGYYQFWPVRTKQEVEDVVASNGGNGAAPVQVSLKPGMNVATLTFEKKH